MDGEENAVAGSCDGIEDNRESEKLKKDKEDGLTVEVSDWRMPIEMFSEAKSDENRKGKYGKKIRKYYKRQDGIIQEFETIYYDSEPQEDDSLDDIARKADISAKVTFAANFLLLIGKLVAVVLSGSLSILSSLVDSAVDLASGIVMWCTNSAMKRKDYYKYPTGKRRMEPLSILVLSVIMSMASAMVIKEGAEKIKDYVQSSQTLGPQVDVATICLICVTIVVKLVLFLVMRKIQTPSVKVLAQDHRNDVFSNSGALIMGFIGSRYWAYADPVGAILIALYILGSWCITAYEQVRLLTGYAANADFQKKITWIAMNHHPHILQIDTVRAYHYGVFFLVEVHIVLPPDMLVRQAHDIQESLQTRLEALDEVERAFVHIDYESEHDPLMEHKLV